MEGFDGLQAPGLALLAVGLGPDNRLPVGLQDQARTGIGQFDAVAGRLPDIEEEGALDRMLVRSGLDMTPFSRKMSAARRMSSRWSVA
jgi:hypothetical protein